MDPVHGIFLPKARTDVVVTAMFDAARSASPAGRDWGFLRFVLVAIVLPVLVAIGVPSLLLWLAPSRGESSLVAVGGLLLVGGLMAAMGLYLGGFDRNELGERVARVPVGRVVERAEGELVMVRGTVSATERGAFGGDISREPRLWTALTLRTSEPRPGAGSLERARTKIVPFTVDDGGTPVLVDATDGLLRAPRHVLQIHSRHSRAAEVRSLAEREGLIIDAGARADASEAGLAPGDHVLVLGVVRRADAYRGETCLACGPWDRLVVTSETRAELIASFGDREMRGLALVGIVVWLAGIVVAIVTSA